MLSFSLPPIVAGAALTPPPAAPVGPEQAYAWTGDLVASLMDQLGAVPPPFPAEGGSFTPVAIPAGSWISFAAEPVKASLVEEKAAAPEEAAPPEKDEPAPEEEIETVVEAVPATPPIAVPTPAVAAPVPQRHDVREPESAGEQEASTESPQALKAPVGAERPTPPVETKADPSIQPVRAVERARVPMVQDRVDKQEVRHEPEPAQTEPPAFDLTIRERARPSAADTGRPASAASSEGKPPAVESADRKPSPPPAAPSAKPERKVEAEPAAAASAPVARSVPEKVQASVSQQPEPGSRNPEGERQEKEKPPKATGAPQPRQSHAAAPPQPEAVRPAVVASDPAPVRHAEPARWAAPVELPQTTRAPAIQDVEIRLPAMDGAAPVDIRFSEKGGQLSVSVRAGDPEMARDLRAKLPELMSSLESKGYESAGPGARESDAVHAVAGDGEPARKASMALESNAASGGDASRRRDFQQQQQQQPQQQPRQQEQDRRRRSDEDPAAGAFTLPEEAS